jgi:hypothetical protein
MALAAVQVETSFQWMTDRRPLGASEDVGVLMAIGDWADMIGNFLGQAA